MATKSETGKPVILFHGDKGGVGKSWACSVFADYLVKAGVSVGLADGDTRNPDVSRMFGDLVPVVNANLRVHEGWMDLTDFLIGHSDRVIVVSMPAGIGAEFRREAGRFLNTLKMLRRTLSMFWVINRLPDSINLLAEALAVVGDDLHGKVVVKNLFFGEADKFLRWENSETKQRFDKAGGRSVVLTELHERTVDKLFSDNEAIMPFSSALVAISDAASSPHKLTPSENMELDGWLKENHRTFEALRPALGI